MEKQIKLQESQESQNASILFLLLLKSQESQKSQNGFVLSVSFCPLYEKDHKRNTPLIYKGCSCDLYRSRKF